MWYCEWCGPDRLMCDRVSNMCGRDGCVWHGERLVLQVTYRYPSSCDLRCCQDIKPKETSHKALQ